MKWISAFLLLIGCTNDKLTDIDGNTYRTVTIGKQVWMAENLRVTRYRNGDTVACTSNGSYGNLYSWQAVNDVRGLAPAGWHIPAEAEVAALIHSLGGDTIAGAALKELGWTLGGYRSNKGRLHTKGSNGYWWMRERSLDLFTWTKRAFTGFADVRRHERYENYALAVRCIKDAAHTEGALESFDASVNRINKAHALFPGINGEGLTVSIKEAPFDTSDIDLRGRCDRVQGTPSTHASIIATIIGGAGNSAHTALGVAPGCRLASSSYKNLSADNFTGAVQNHSYGTTIENYYGAEAFSYDKSNKVLHVFSAGNAGASASLQGRYANIEGFANITGTFKMAKNNLVVSAIDSFGNDMVYISKGPAYDGRLKPELAAFTVGGSSGSAAIVSGAALLVQQLCRERFGSVPNPALVKAILINSADDAGPPGIDFSTGYGSVNLSRALENTAAQKFASGHTVVSVPPNTSLLKATLVWADEPGEGLINDLDLTITDPHGKVWLPWVLNHYPHADSLRQPAVRKEDHLNNVEQVSIDLPAAGHYSINVKGNAPYFIAWDYELKDQFSWDYPVGIDHVSAGQQVLLRWRNSYDATGVLQWRAGAGPWQTINASVDLSKGYVYWRSPDNSTTAQLRMLIGSAAFVSDVFTIADPMPFVLSYNCKDSVTLRWPPRYDSYQVYHLGKLGLQLLITTRDTLVRLPASSRHYTVIPFFSNGKRAIQSITQSYAPCFVNKTYHLYPNPVNADQSITIVGAGTSLHLYSLQGQLLRKKVLTGTVNTLHTYGLPKGAYVYVINGLFSGKLVIQ